MLRPRVCYMKDYFWLRENQENIEHPYSSVSASQFLQPTDSLGYYRWYDPYYTEGGDTPAWWHAYKLNSDIHHNYHHQYLNGTRAKGLFGITGVEDEFINIAYGCDRVDAGSPVGFRGQFGNETSMYQKGNTYDFEFSFQCGVEDIVGYIPPPMGPPVPGAMNINSQYAPFGFTIYSSYKGNTYDTHVDTDTDGVHIIIVPEVTYLSLNDINGTPVPITGSAVVLATGQLEASTGNDGFDDLVYVTHWTEYNNGDNIDILAPDFPDFEESDKEWFCRVEYAPLDYPLDNRQEVSIWLGQKKHSKKYIGSHRIYEYLTTDTEQRYNYMSRFVNTFTINKQDLDTSPDLDEISPAYLTTLVRYDGVVVGSSFFSFNEIFVHEGFTEDTPFARIKMDETMDDTNHDPQVDTSLATFITPETEIEIWANTLKSNRGTTAVFEDELIDDPSGNGWSETGTWDNNDDYTNYYKEDFLLEMSDIDHDESWSVASGTGDTISNTGYLTVNNGDIKRTGDWHIGEYFHFLTNIDPLENSNWEFYLHSLNKNEDGHIRIQATSSTTFNVDEYDATGSSYTTHDTVTHAKTGEVEVEMIRQRDRLKIYLDFQLVSNVILDTVPPVNTDNMILSSAGAVNILYGSVYVRPPISRGYVHVR